MALSKKPTTGMKDILPEEMQIRDYVISVIKDTYGKFGFTSIETPCVENIANLSSKQGGENEKLIFKILKRGEKLNVAAATTEEEVVDSGLRYDLTVPLVRYYSNNAASLPSPFSIRYATCFGLVGTWKPLSMSSMMIRSKPMENPQAGTSLPVNLPTILS